MVSLPEEIFQETYGKVKKLIVTKKLVPGQLITEHRLSHTLRINDDTVPVVLQQLKRESLLVGNLDSGLSVRELCEQEVVEMFDCRIALETMAVKLFTRNAPQSKIDDLRNLLVPFENGPQNGYVFYKIDRYFHEFIIKNCGNRSLYQLYKSAKILPFMDLVGLNRPLNVILQEHLDLVSAMHQRDDIKAFEVMSMNLENSKRSHI
ncbi:GntR family transcriptional regulator [Maribacter caenipelagi]|uniref:GntR family transcriptional regulator n=1 Tax=Maribacter caenipelagi TaxID=1447781 RepID=A0A4R7CW95_9FLAO|nr:GntR family transcriptional regulator [Maribacter caenipelagi]TDS12749.1 GntR family transcriptional regulator [Maribacter caenipelagi]